MHEVPYHRHIHTSPRNLIQTANTMVLSTAYRIAIINGEVRILRASVAT